MTKYQHQTHILRENQTQKFFNPVLVNIETSEGLGCGFTFGLFLVGIGLGYLIIF